MLRERNWSIPELKLFVAELSERDPELVNELRAIGAPATPEALPAHAKALNEAVGGQEAFAAGDDAGLLESIIVAQGRPVLPIVQNSVDTSKINDPMAALIKKRLDAAKAFLDPAVPAIGRVELANNPMFEWVGTAWVVDDGLLVTNRHVAEIFGMADGARFVFRPGLDLGRPQTGRIDFLEEVGRADALEAPITEILWISPPTGPDVAFLRVDTHTIKGARRIELESQLPKKDDQICVIGYPARDSRIPDSELMDRIYGKVYDKKRLAPGQILGANEKVIMHDCTTLGGNSGSVVLSLATGRALALHFSGTFMRSNFAVPASLLSGLLRNPPWQASGRRRELPLAPPPEKSGVSADATGSPAPSGAGVSTIPGGIRVTVPVTIDVRLGGDGLATDVGLGPAKPKWPATAGPGIPPVVPLTSFADALAAVRDKLRGRQEVVSVRGGYEFRDGWITDDQAVVVRLEPGPDMSHEALGLAESIAGVPIEVRAAEATELAQVQHGMGQAEAPHAFVSHYKRSLTAKFALPRVDDTMRVVLHASPDAGWPVLSKFLDGIDRDFVLAMYDFSAPHIVAKLEGVMHGTARRHKAFKLVLDPNESFGEGTKADDLAEATVIERLTKVANLDFENAFAPVRGPKRLFDSAYHIKVGVRDDGQFWLSSGNWQSSNQPDLGLLAGTTDGGPLRTFNREWHVVVANQRLADAFRAHIEQDFKDAQNVPEIPGGAEEPEVLVPIELLEVPDEELPTRVRYFEPLELNERMRVQPLLTPDNYFKPVLDLIASAQDRVLFQNQSFKPGASGNEDNFSELLSALKKKQKAGLDVRIIFRKIGDVAGTLERIKDFGFDTSRTKLRVQTNCHNKGIVVDSDKVLVGSQNWTTAGTQFNRDASLIIENTKIADYFAKIFEFDWQRIATGRADSGRASREVRLVMPGVEATTPAGYVRMKWHDWTGG